MPAPFIALLLLIFPAALRPYRAIFVSLVKNTMSSLTLTDNITEIWMFIDYILLLQIIFTGQQGHCVTCCLFTKGILNYFFLLGESEKTTKENNLSIHLLFS